MPQSAEILEDAVPDQADDTAAGDQSREELQIELSFEVGRSQAAVSQLRTLQPGYIFELDSRVDNPVAIRANGRLIGKGNLVRIGDRIGIQTTELSSHVD